MYSEICPPDLVVSAKWLSSRFSIRLNYIANTTNCRKYETRCKRRDKTRAALRMVYCQFSRWTIKPSLEVAPTTQTAFFVYGRLKQWYSQLNEKIRQDSSVLGVRHFGPYDKTVRHLCPNSLLDTGMVPKCQDSSDLPNQCWNVLGPKCLKFEVSGFPNVAKMQQSQTLLRHCCVAGVDRALEVTRICSRIDMHSHVAPHTGPCP